MKKIVLVLMSLLMIASLAVPAIAADEGMIFTAEQTHPLNKTLDKGPQTFEAVVRLPKDYTARAGLILSSYKSNGNTAISLQINSGKVLELYYEIDAEKAANVRHKFTEIPVTRIATGEWVHIAVVKDEANGKAHAYINGEFIQTAENATQPYGYFSGKVEPLAPCIGGDHRTGNGQYWKGEIREIALYSDVRTADEIKADAKEIKSDKDMTLWLQLEKGMTAAKDLSGNGNHMGDYKEPETTQAQTTESAQTPAPTAPQTFDAAVVLAAVVSAAGAGVVVSKKRK